jgi:hypothetical protein
VTLSDSLRKDAGLIGVKPPFGAERYFYHDGGVMEIRMEVDVHVTNVSLAFPATAVRGQMHFHRSGISGSAVGRPQAGIQVFFVEVQPERAIWASTALLMGKPGTR